MVNCRINSIFYQSLFKIIKDKTDFVIIATSEKQAKDLEIKHLRDVVEVEISDLDDFSGIQIHGNPDAVKVLEDIMFDNFSDSIIRRQLIQLHAIYQGRVVHYNHHKQFGIVDIGESFNAIMFNPDLKRGQEMTVQIKQLPPSEDQLPVVADTIHLSGDYVILEVEGDYVRVSRKVVGDDRKKVYELGNEIKPGNFGVIMRTSAINASVEEVQEEVNTLVGTWEDLELDISTAFEPDKISAGEAATNIYLPGRSKHELSIIKNTISKSIPDYYSLKTYSRYSQSILNLADKLVHDVDPIKIQKAIYQTILEEDFIPERFVRLEFSNLMLEPIHLNVGYPDLSINEEEMVFVKRIESPDEIEREDEEGVKGIEVGDIIKTITAIGSWTTHRQYFGNDEEIKAEKVVIHTPLEISYRGKMRAIDLGIWLIKDQNGFIVEYNNEDIEYHIEENEVNAKLKELVNEVNKKVVERYEQPMTSVIIRDV